MILNLAYPEKGDVKFHVSKFPDGQQSVTIENVEKKTIDMDPGFVFIKARLNNFMDLEILACTVKALNGLGYYRMSLYVPYFLGSRSDRKFSDGSVNYLRDVICPIVNSLNFESIEVLDPHSYVLEACLQGFRGKTNVHLVGWALNKLENPNIVLISPDEGASKKIFNVAGQVPVVIASKHRDLETGKFLGFNVPLEEKHLDKDLVWVDDICDGGGTFIGEAEEANLKGHRGKKYLIVTHGIFSQGFAELTKHFSHIYCTNSYSNVGDISGNGLEKTYCSQYNVF